MNNPSAIINLHPLLFIPIALPQFMILKFSSPRSLTFHVPWFDGSEPLGWILQGYHFFDIHHTLNNQLIIISSFYMHGPALGWFQWMHHNGQLSSWHDLLNSLEIRLPPHDMMNPKDLSLNSPNNLQ